MLIRVGDEALSKSIESKFDSACCASILYVKFGIGKGLVGDMITA